MYGKHRKGDDMSIDATKYQEQVKGPGKFEGEPAETTYYWDRMLEGDGDSVARWSDDDPDGECEPVFDGELFEVDCEESEAFDLPIGSYVVLWTDSQGFTMSKNFETREAVDSWIDSYLS